MKWTGVVFCSIGLLWGELRVGQFRTLDESRKELQNIGDIAKDQESWQVRRELVRGGIRDGIGFKKWPKKTKMRIVRHSRVERDGYTVENVGIEQSPDTFCAVISICPKLPSIKCRSFFVPMAIGLRRIFTIMEDTAMRCNIAVVH